MSTSDPILTAREIAVELRCTRARLTSSLTEMSQESPKSRRFLSAGRRLFGDRVSRPGNAPLKSVLFFLPTQKKQTPWARCIKECTCANGFK